MKILIAGASGLVGKKLQGFLIERGHTVYRLIRRKKTPTPLFEIYWNPEAGVVLANQLEDFDVFVNLSGENIATLWTEKKRKAILESRIKATRLLVETIDQLKNPPKVFISASAIGFYGNRESEWLSEKSSKGLGFLADVCAAWEEEAYKAKNTRVVISRIGMVLSAKGGGLANMVPPFKLGLGGRFGSGEQYISWIAIDDLVGALLFVINTPSITGPVNLVAPNPVTNAVFTKTLGKVLSRPTLFPVPAAILKLLLGDLARELLLASQRVKPEVLEENGYVFQYPDLEDAFRYLLQ